MFWRGFGFVHVLFIWYHNHPMKILVLAEKPSQARQFYVPLLERISGEKLVKKGDFFESSSYYVSWFYGHLMQTWEPVEYDQKYKNWSLEDLPILPDPIKYRYRDDKIKVHGGLLLKLCQNSDKIVCATDPDREGEGIFRGFYDFHKLEKPVKRLWAVSLTDDDLLKSWNNMKDASAYDNLSAARYMRSSADWLVGMNVSRAYSVCAYAKLPIGRVLTATLALIVARDREVESYRELFTYGLTAMWNGYLFTFFNEDGSKFEQESFCESVLNAVRENEFFLVLFKEENRIENPPRTFNLPELQKEASRQFGFSLDRTLEIAQRLYEKKLTTYPRTDSQFLPVSDLDKYYELIERLADEKEKKYMRPDRENVPSVKDTDSAHTALVPTGNVPEGLSKDESDLYELIRERFVTAFMNPRKYKQYIMEIDDGQGHKFKARMTFDVDKGFKELRTRARDDDEKEKDMDDQVLLQAPLEEELKVKSSKVESAQIQKTKKAKPKYYTAATLITAMQNCGKLLDDEQSRQTLKEVRGIGTPATQATYPVNLERYGYIKTVKKNFVSTPKGRSLIASVKKEFTSPELTADWEYKLQQIERGRFSADEFDKQIREYVKDIVEYVKKHGRDEVSVVKDKDDPEKLIGCPVCGRYLRELDWGWVCARACGLKISKEIAGKKILLEQIKKLISNGTSDMINGFKSKTGREFAARLVLNGTKIDFDFSYPYPCPKCGGTLDDFKQIIVCSKKCGFELRKTVNNKQLTDRNIEDLLLKARTSVIKGFTSRKSGENFSARLILDKNLRLKFEL